MAEENDGEDEGEVATLPDEESSVEDTDDGGAIVKMGGEDEEPADEDDFYSNLAEKMEETDLNRICTELIDLIEYDRKAREDRDKIQAKATERTGLTDQNGKAAFVGASEATHPMLAKAYVDYQSRTIHEIMPANGPVKDFIPGEPTQERVEKARRKVAFMNWQFKIQMPEFRPELEQLLGAQIVGGSQYLRLVYDSRKRRPVPIFVATDDVYLPYAASSLYTAERDTYCEHITEFEFNSRIRSGLYRKIDAVSSVSSPEQSRSEKKSDEVEGKSPNAYNEDGLRDIYNVETYADIEELAAGEAPQVAGRTKQDSSLNVDETETEPRPYLITIDKHSNKILAIVRNWDKDDETFQPLSWMIEWPLIPWRGAQSVGLGQLIGSLAGASTGALRALLDSALVNNLATLVKVKGANTSGQTLDLEYGKITEIEGGIAGDSDIRKLLMAVPWNPPSMALFQLLGMMTEYGEEVIKTAFQSLAETANPNMPVGTTLALIEQGMKVLSAIHLRLHNAMDRVIQVLHRINRMYLTDEQIMDSTGEQMAFRSDFEGPLDVVPVSDPEVFSDIQRFAQMQVVAQRAQLNPDLYDRRKVECLILQRTKIPDAEDLLMPIPNIDETNFVNENVALALGQPARAYPDQEAEAHIQGHLDFYQCPILGQNPLIAPKLTGPMMQHLAEHLVYWYLNAMMKTTNSAVQVDNPGGDITHALKHKDPETGQELDKTLAAASPKVCAGAVETFAKLPPIIQQAQQALAQYAQQAAQAASADPSVQTAKIVTGAKSADVQVQTAAKTASDAADQRNELAIAEQEQEGDDARTAAELQVKTQVNADDNATALEIAAGKIATGHSTNVSTGTSIEKHGGT